MTKVLGTIGKVTHFNLQDSETEITPGVCDKISKEKRRRASRSRSRGLERTLPPICRYGSQYPPGCTVLECRFEADRPVARIVQVPVDVAATARDPRRPRTETRPSSSGSKVTSRREDVKQRISSTDVCSETRTTDKFVLLPVSYILKPHDPIDDSTALTDKVKVPVKTASSAGILEFDESEKQTDDSRISRRSSSRKISGAPYCDDKSPVTFIECITTPKGPLARVTRCSTETSDGANYYIYLGSKVKEGSSCKIVQLSPVKKTVSDQKARVPGERPVPEQGVPCRKSKPEVTRRSYPDCKLAYPGSLKKPSRECKGRVCPGCCCCQPVRPTAKKARSDFLRTKTSTADARASPAEMCTRRKRLGEQRLQRLASERLLQTEVTQIKSARSDEASACRKSAVADFRRARSIPEGIPGDTSRLPSSRELLARYRDCIPAYQFERYEVCRAKRNGLQDECIPPLLRTILKKEERRRTLDKCIEREQSIDRLDGTSDSMNPDQIELLLCTE